MAGRRQIKESAVTLPQTVLATAAPGPTMTNHQEVPFATLIILYLHSPTAISPNVCPEPFFLDILNSISAVPCAKEDRGHVQTVSYPIVSG